MSKAADTFLPKSHSGRNGDRCHCHSCYGRAGSDRRRKGSKKKDEVFQVKAVLQVPSTAGNTAGTFFSFDISWFDFKLNKYFLADTQQQGDRRHRSK